jgi:hypothetical protein
MALRNCLDEELR